MRAAWPAFHAKRAQRLQQQERHGQAAEKVAENIVEDLFTMVLDWALGEINNQVGYADILLTRQGIKHLLVEVKRPGALAWNRRAVEAALEQARRYAAEQKVACVAVTDGLMLYAADVEHGGLNDRAFLALDAADPVEDLWWLSVHGIYRPRQHDGTAALRLLPEPCHAAAPGTNEELTGALLHHKYKLPCTCFAYVGDASDPGTWKLPYRHLDGSIDGARLPKAVQAILTNFRGVQVHGIPEAAIPDVLVRLAQVASQLGKMPHQGGHTAPAYEQLAAALDQLGRLEEVAIIK